MTDKYDPDKKWTELSIVFADWPQSDTRSLRKVGLAVHDTLYWGIGQGRPINLELLAKMSAVAGAMFARGATLNETKNGLREIAQEYSVQL